MKEVANSISTKVSVLCEPIHIVVKYSFGIRHGKSTTKTMSFKLVLNTDNLFWTVEQISDGIS